MQVMAAHTEANIVEAVRILKAAKASAEQELQQMEEAPFRARNVAA
jgi:hypothetical protein